MSRSAARRSKEECVWGGRHGKQRACKKCKQRACKEREVGVPLPAGQRKGEKGERRGLAFRALEPTLCGSPAKFRSYIQCFGATVGQHASGKDRERTETTKRQTRAGRETGARNNRYPT
eukprot:345140-Chlamydomonas_euryale.AAC.2